MPENTLTYEQEVADLEAVFTFEDCAECGAGLDAHTISPDPFGHPHAWCKKENPR